MEKQFVETIKIKNGKVMSLSYHQERMNKTMQHFFPGKDIPCLEERIAPTNDMDFYKARIVYGEGGIEDIQYAPYSMKEIHTLKIVKDNDIDYSFKSTDRTCLNRLATQKGNCDEIIIIKNALVTDTSFTSIAIFKDGKWLTPKHPLLLGTKRAALLEKGIIQEDDITFEDLMKAEKVSLFNAMIDFGEREVMAQDIYQDEYRIREIRPSDDESICEIARSAFEEFRAPLTGSVYCDPRMEHLSQEFLREDAKYWVIENTDGEILGGGGFYPTEGLPLGMAEVVKLYFSPSLRGKGYGRKMLSLIEQEAQKAGYKELYIESFPEFAKAVSLYEKVGFKHITHALGNSGHPAVTVWMTKTI